MEQSGSMSPIRPILGNPNSRTPGPPSTPPPPGGPPRPPGGPGSKPPKRRGISKDTELQKAVVRETFYANGKPSFVGASTVAKKLGLRIPAVISLLFAAYKNRLFSVDVNIPYDEIELATLADKVKVRYGLIAVILIPGNPEILAPSGPEHRRSLHQQTIRALVRRAAKFLDDHLLELAKREGGDVAVRLGVAWGFTTRTLAAYLRNTERPLTMPGLEVVPIIGSTAVAYSEGAEANTIAVDVADRYHGRSLQLPCSAFANRGHQADIVKKTRHVHQMLKKIAECDIVITSMGPVLGGEDNDTKVANDQMLSGKLLSLAAGAGAIAQICSWFVGADGEEVETEFEAIGLGFKGLQRLAAKAAKRVILVVGGDRRRFESVRAILTARLVSVLITDTVTAECLADAA